MSLSFSGIIPFSLCWCIHMHIHIHIHTYIYILLPALLVPLFFLFASQCFFFFFLLFSLFFFSLAYSSSVRLIEFGYKSNRIEAGKRETGSFLVRYYVCMYVCMHVTVF